MMATQTQTSPQGLLTDSRPWATYERRSKRRAGGKVSNDGIGQNLSEDNQHAENVAYIQRLDPHAEVLDFRDNASAWTGAERPDFERLLTMLAAGQLRGVVAFHADRYTRQPGVFERLVSACEQGRAQLHTAMGGHHADPTMIRIESALSWKESKVKSDRQKLHHGNLAREGRFHGGQRRYGYEKGMADIRESEAQWVRWLAQGVLAGRSLNSLTQELNANGARTVSGKEWRPGNVGTLLRGPHLAGLRKHQGDVIGAGTWQPILDQGTWEAVRTLLENPERRTSKSQARRYLLSGVALCGGCGGTMRGRSNGTRATAPSYFCNACGVSRRADLVNKTVVLDWIIPRLEKLSPTGALEAPELVPDSRPALEAEMAQLDANLATLGAQAVLNGWAPEVVQGATQAATERKAEIRAQLADLALVDTQPSAVLEGATGPNAAAVWASLDLDRQRAVVDLLCTVTIHRATRKGAPFDPELIQVEWK
jgi:DNA invertase Pin-like site-specific DNA recombinase